MLRNELNTTEDYKRSIDELKNKIKGKGVDEALPYILDFANQASKNKSLNKAEMGNIISELLSTMKDEDKRKLMMFLSLLNNK